MRSPEPGRNALLDAGQRLLGSADLARIFFLQLSVFGSTMGSRDQLARLVTFCEQTGVRPLIDRTLPMSEAKQGFEAMIKGELFGKVVFTP